MLRIDRNLEYRNSSIEKQVSRFRDAPMKMAQMKEEIDLLSSLIDELNDLQNEAFGEGFHRGVILMTTALLNKSNGSRYM